MNIWKDWLESPLDREGVATNFLNAFKEKDKFLVDMYVLTIENDPQSISIVW